MPKFVNYIKRYWLTSLFLMSIIAASSIMTFGTAAPENYFCAADDKSVAVCIRNWVNSGGSIMAVLVAVAAAAIGLGQLNANRKQVSASILAPLADRLADISKMHSITCNIYNELYTLIRHLKKLEEYVEQGVDHIALTREANNVVNQERKIENSRDELELLANNIRMHHDLSKAAFEVLQSSYCRSDNDVGILLQNVFKISDSNRGLGFEIGLGIVNIQQQSFYFKRAIPKLERKFAEIESSINYYVELAEPVKKKQIEALGLDPES